MGSGHTRRSLQEAHSAPLQTALKSACTRSTVSKSSVQKPSSKLRLPSPLAPSPAPVRLALPRYTQAPSTSTALKCTRGQIFSSSPPPVSRRRFSNEARKGREGSSACRIRSATPRAESSEKSASTEANFPPRSTCMSFTLAVAMETDSRACASLSRITSRYNSLPESSAASMARMAAAMPRRAAEATLLDAARRTRRRAHAVLGPARAGVPGVARIAPQIGPGRVGEARVVAHEGEDGGARRGEEAALAVHGGVAQRVARRLERPGELVSLVCEQALAAPAREVDVPVGALQRHHPDAGRAADGHEPGPIAVGRVEGRRVDAAVRELRGVQFAVDAEGRLAGQSRGQRLRPGLRQG